MDREMRPKVTDAGLEKMARVWRDILPEAADQYGVAIAALGRTYGAADSGKEHPLSEVDGAWPRAVDACDGAVHVLETMRQTLCLTADRTREAMARYADTDRRRAAGMPDTGAARRRER